MSIARTLIPLFVLALLALPTSAITVSSHGTGSVSYGSRLNADVRSQALAKAKLSALESYLAQSNGAKIKLFEARRDEFIAQVDRIVPSAVVLSEQEDKKAKTFTITVRAEVDVAQLQALFDSASAVANTRAADRSLLTFLFMARMQDSVQSFDDKVYKRQDVRQAQSTDRSVSEKTSEGESFRNSSISTSGSARTRQGTVSESSTATTTGGSTTRRSDAVAWKVANAAEVNTAMTGNFSAAGYEVVEAEYVEGESGGLLSIDRIRKDFSTGNDLSPETLRNTANGVRNAGIPYIAVGTLDVGLRDTDPVSGNIRVFVTVTGKVLNVTGRFPRTVSSVGPVQFAGLGPNESVARTNALRIAAQEASQQMIDELNVKAVH